MAEIKRTYPVILEHRGYSGELVDDIEPFVKIVGITDYASEPAGDDPSAAFRDLVDDYIQTCAELNRPS